MLPNGWSQLQYHEGQSQLWRCPDRFVGVACGRGSGKSELARRRIVRFLPVRKMWPDPMYFYALPTYPQARRVAWQKILQLVPRDWLAKEPNQSEMLIETVFGSKLYVVGMDKPQRIEGDQWDGGVIDESCDQKPGHFDRSIRPALAHRSGWCWRIGVPKRFGVGAKDFKHFCEKVAQSHFNWSSHGIIDSQELYDAEAMLDPRDYNEQFGAKWQDAEGRVYYAFDDTLDTDPDVRLDPSLPLLIGSDFNVDPMCWVIAQAHGQELHCIDEIFIRNTNTQRTLNTLYDRYGDREKGYVFFGDATSQRRQTSAVASDYATIARDVRFQPARIKYPRSNPSRIDRYAAVNAHFQSAAGIRRVRIHPRCRALITDLSDLAYVEGTREIQVSHDTGHMTDGLGYMIYRMWPVKIRRGDDELLDVGTTDG